MNRLLSTILIFIIGNVSAQELIIEGQVLDIENKTPVVYATIAETLKGIHGTTTDQKGHFKLVLKDINEKSHLYISSVGYRDTTISVQDILKEKSIFLKPAFQDLGEFVFRQQEMDTTEIGDSRAKIYEDHGYQASPGFYWGAYFKTKNKESGGILNSFSIHINNKGFPTTPLLIRFFEFTGEFEFFRSQDKKLFKELTKETIIMDNNKIGWNRIELKELSIIIPRSGIYCMISPIDEIEAFEFKTVAGTKLGSTIGVYNSPKDSKRIFPAIQDNNRLSVFRKSHAHTPAMAIEILTY